MARIYYHEEKLSGKPIRSHVINVQRLDYILNHTDVVDIDFQQYTTPSLFGKLFTGKANTFKKAQLRRDNLYYESEKGTFYLPSGVIFFDRLDYNFPSWFYFVAKIGHQVECRKCKGGKDVAWYQIPDLHLSVHEPEIVQKMESTVIEIEKLIRKKGTGKINAVPKKHTAVKPSIPLNDVQKQAYNKLSELCVHNQTDKRKIGAFIKTLLDYEGDDDYMTTLNYFMDFLDTENLGFIMRMDCKADIAELKWMLDVRLKRQHNLILELPSAAQYSKNISVSADGVFEDFNQVLRKYGLQLGFVDTQSDEYIAVLHAIADKEAVKRAVINIGYDYYEHVEY